MTIVIPEEYHIKAALQKQRVHCISNQNALRQDIRALRIGILNIMPAAESYEFSLLFPLGRSIIQIVPVWLKLKNHAYRSSSREHLDNHYLYFEEAVRHKHLDGLILTGAPVESIPFAEVNYWEELTAIIKYARQHVASTLGICWGGLALARYMGLEKENYREKLFGIFKTKNINRRHRITGEHDDYFWCPQSRHAGIADQVLEKQQEQGKLNLLAYAEEAGYTILESADKRFLMHLGHPEYDANRLV
ncbi:MAG TPA: homoserine O-succinyltransferase, partial [Spirochaetota bacterium]|nr:homoserine O-succinyltransferase [Spirochaetota bacterium]